MYRTIYIHKEQSARATSLIKHIKNFHTKYDGSFTEFYEKETKKSRK
jgi:hypothetical protein